MKTTPFDGKNVNCPKMFDQGCTFYTHQPLCAHRGLGANLSFQPAHALCFAPVGHRSYPTILPLNHFSRIITCYNRNRPNPNRKRQKSPPPQPKLVILVQHVDLLSYQFPAASSSLSPSRRKLPDQGPLKTRLAPR